MNKERATILIVDDLPENLDILKSLLENDYNIKAATSGEIALKIVRSSSPPDLVLLDVVMPGMDGIQVYHELKNDSVTAGIPIVFVSGDSRDESMFEAIDDEPIKLQKPVEVKVLTETINKILS